MLEKIVVLDLSRALAGPHAAMMLGDLGARVIKVERPGVGDDSRKWGPPFIGADAERVSTYYMSCNRNKESITLDLKDETDRARFFGLVRRADVLIESFRPGVMDSLGFSNDELRMANPRLIVGSITGFGHDGPDAARAGYDQIAQGEGGLMSLTGLEGLPTKVGVPIADVLAGMNLAFGLTSALAERELSGKVRTVRTSLLASIVAAQAFQGTRWTLAKEVPTPAGNHHPTIAPYGMYKTKTAMVQIAVGNEGLWQRFAPLIGLDRDDSRFDVNDKRVAAAASLTEIIEAAFAEDDAEAVLERCLAAGIPAGNIRTLDDVFGWAQTLSQGLLKVMDHPRLGSLAVPGSALRFDDQAYSGDRELDEAPPMLNEHSEQLELWMAEIDAPSR